MNEYFIPVVFRVSIVIGSYNFVLSPLRWQRYSKLGKLFTKNMFYIRFGPFSITRISSECARKIKQIKEKGKANAVHGSKQANATRNR